MSSKKKSVKQTVTQNSGPNSGEKKRGRVENLKPFKPGQSGNPGGRPKRKLISDALKDMLANAIESSDHSQAEAIGIAMIAAAMGGDVRAAVFVRDTVEGKPLQKIEVSRDEFSGHTNEEIRFFAENGYWPTDAVLVKSAGNA